MKKNERLQQTLQIYGTSPAPSRDYHGLTITPELVTLNSWHVAHGPYVFPKVKKCSIEDYPYDTLLQTDVINVFGDHLHFYLMDLATGESCLSTIPNNLMLKILRMLSYRDILRVSQTSKIFWELCNTNAVWKLIFNKRRNFPVSRENLRQGETIGWKSVLRSKLENRVIQSLKQSMRGTFYRPFAVTTLYTKPTLNYTFITNNTKTTNSTITPMKIPQKNTVNINTKTVNSLRTESVSKVNPRKPSTAEAKSKIKIPKTLNYSKSTSKLIDKDKLYSTPSLLSKSTVLLKKVTSKPKTDLQKKQHSISKFTK